MAIANFEPLMDEEELPPMKNVMNTHKRKEEPSSWPNPFPRDQKWIHAVTGDSFDFFCFLPKTNGSNFHKMCWADGLVGGYTFCPNPGTRIDLLYGIKGIGYPAVLVYDQDGHGAIFIKAGYDSPNYI